MNVVVEVKVLSKGEHPEGGELQLRTGDRPGAALQLCGAIYFTRTEMGVNSGEVIQSF
jgi:hypothetical protein